MTGLITDSEREEATMECQYDDCAWSTVYDPESETSELSADAKAVSHFEQVHGGRARVRVVLEADVYAAPGTTREKFTEGAIDDVREALESLDTHGTSLPSALFALCRYDLAFASAEWTDEPDDLPGDTDA